MQQIKLRQFAPIYVFMGEEPYFIDKLTDAIEQTVLAEDEKFMNLGIHYGKDCKIDELLNEARQYPTMSPLRLVMLKEAQTVDNKNKLDLLEHYLKKPMPTTVLVVAYKYGTIDRRKKWMAAADNIGVVFTSEKLRDYNLSPFIGQLAKNAGISMDAEAVDLLAQYVGADLKLLESTVEKLKLQTGGKKRIGTDIIASSVGISKDYSAFELVSALIDRDHEKCFRIAGHCSAAIQQTIAVLFNYFSGLIIYQYLADKSKENAVAKLKINPYFLKDYVKGAANYSKMQVFNAIGYLRQYDGKSKGAGNLSADDEALLKELIFKILH